MPKIIENLEERILEHAAQILKEAGHEALNMRSIAKSCGIATGTLYNYYPTKKDLLLRLMSLYWEDFFDLSNAQFPESTDLFTGLKMIYDAIMGFMDRFRETWTALQSEQGAVYQPHGSEQQLVQMQRLQGMIEKLLQTESQRRPSLQMPLPPSEMGLFIMHNFLIMCQMKPFSYPSFEAILRRLL